MHIAKLFAKSLYSLKAISFFRFQKIEKTINYLFILSFLVSLPTLFLFFFSFFINGFSEFGSLLQIPTASEQNMSDSAAPGVIPIFVFLAVLFIILGVSMVQFIAVSLLAAAGLFIKRLAKRRLDYKHLWNMSAYAVTLPAVIIGLSALLPFSLPLPAVLYFLLSLAILILAIQKVPIPKSKK